MPLIGQVPTSEDTAKGVRPNPMIPAHSKLSASDRSALRSRVTNEILKNFLEYPYHWTPESLANFSRAPEGTLFYGIATQTGEAYAFNMNTAQSQAMIHNAFSINDMCTNGHEAVARELGLYSGTASGQVPRDGQVIGFAVRKTAYGIEIDRARSFFNNQLGKNRDLPNELVERLNDELGDVGRDLADELQLEDYTFGKLIENLPEEVKPCALRLFILCQTAVWSPIAQLPSSFTADLKGARIALAEAWRACISRGYQINDRDTTSINELKVQLQLAVKLAFKTYSLKKSLQDNIKKALENLDITGVQPLVSPIAKDGLGQILFQSGDSAKAMMGETGIAGLFNFFDDKSIDSESLLVDGVIAYLDQKLSRLSESGLPYRNFLSAILVAVKNIAMAKFCDIPRHLEDDLISARSNFMKAAQSGSSRVSDEEIEVEEIYKSTCKMIFNSELTPGLPFAFFELFTIYSLDRRMGSISVSSREIKGKLVRLNAWVATQPDPISGVDNLRKQLCRLAVSQSVFEGLPKMVLEPELNFGNIAATLPPSLKASAARLLNASSSFVKDPGAAKKPYIEELLRAKIDYCRTLKSFDEKNYPFTDDDKFALSVISASYINIYDRAFEFGYYSRPNGLSLSATTKSLFSAYPTTEIRNLFLVPTHLSKAPVYGIDSIEKAMAEVKSSIAISWDDIQTNLPGLKARYQLLAAAIFILNDDPNAPFNPPGLDASGNNL